MHLAVVQHLVAPPQRMGAKGTNTKEVGTDDRAAEPKTRAIGCGPRCAPLRCPDDGSVCSALVANWFDQRLVLRFWNDRHIVPLGLGSGSRGSRHRHQPPERKRENAFDRGMTPRVSVCVTSATSAASLFVIGSLAGSGLSPWTAEDGQRRDNARRWRSSDLFAAKLGGDLFRLQHVLDCCQSRGEIT